MLAAATDGKPQTLCATFMTLPTDIKNKIGQTFKSPIERQEVEQLLLTLWTMPLNVGKDQLARSILIIADGNIIELKKIFATHFSADPRDIIMQAEIKIGNPGHYFIRPFDDKDITEPPDFLDGAKVINWAWAGQEPFGFVVNSDDNNKNVAIYGLAICQYQGEESVYRFSCDKNWETIQDGLYDNIKEAINELPEQYKKTNADWKTK